MDENVILQLFIAFKDDLVPADKRSPQEICEAYKQFKEVAERALANPVKPSVKPVGAKLESSRFTKY